MHNFSISKDAFGNLQLIDQDGATHEKVRIIRAFPISDPDHGFAIVDDHGHEVAWFEDLNALQKNSVLSQRMSYLRWSLFRSSNVF